MRKVRTAPIENPEDPYLSVALAKNELNRADSYHQKLFLRIKKGLYGINPAISLRATPQDEWQNIYAFMQLPPLQ